MGKTKKAIIKADERKSKAWHQDMVGQEITVKPYPYKATVGGDLDGFCNCNECQQNIRGKKLYTYYEVVSGYKNIGSIIPEFCLEFVK